MRFIIWSAIISTLDQVAAIDVLNQGRLRFLEYKYLQCTFQVWDSRLQSISSWLCAKYSNNRKIRYKHFHPNSRPFHPLRSQTVFKLSLPLQKFSKSSRDGPRRSSPFLRNQVFPVIIPTAPTPSDTSKAATRTITVYALLTPYLSIVTRVVLSQQVWPPAEPLASESKECQRFRQVPWDASNIQNGFWYFHADFDATIRLPIKMSTFIEEIFQISSRKQKMFELLKQAAWEHCWGILAGWDYWTQGVQLFVTQSGGSSWSKHSLTMFWGNSGCSQFRVNSPAFHLHLLSSKKLVDLGFVQELRMPHNSTTSCGQKQIPTVVVK